MSLHDPVAVRTLAERLVAIPSVSPDVAGEKRCAQALIESLPPGLEHGRWATADGRPVVWARVRGRTPRTLVLLGHCDTVGHDEYAALGAPAGAAIALDPAALREWLTSQGAAREVSPTVEADIAEEWRHPGTWMFGRGALDMKSGLAAGVAALAALAERAGTLAGNVMLIVTPDEENLSEGMKAALEAIALAERAGEFELAGILNLDYVDAPAAYRGAMGKTRVGLWILGRAAHASLPFEAIDAAQIGAELALRATLALALADLWEEQIGPPPVVLRLRDLKTRYDVQTAAEAMLELNVLAFTRAPEETLERVRALALMAILDVLRRRDALRGEMKPAGGPRTVESTPAVLSFEELGRRVTWSIEQVLNAALSEAASGATDQGDWTAEVRALAMRARLMGPAIVMRILPPQYPAVPPIDGPVSRAAAGVLGQEGLELRSFYPFITDASLLAGRVPPAGSKRTRLEIAASDPASPYPADRLLLGARGVDVVTLGPWGRDAHGLFERVHAPYAFERLPRLIAEVAQAALRV